MKIVDISAWQDNFDWDYFISLGVEGVIIKIGEGNRLDSMFVEHVNNAVAHGLPYGVYYYTHASSYDEAVADADSVAGWISEYLNGQTPEYVPLWSAQYNSYDNLSDEYPGRVRIWQYTDNFYGVDGDVYYR